MPRHPALDQAAHRPWPLPRGPWLGRQSWRDLLFAHWPVEAGAVRSLVPAGLDIDTFDDATYVGIVPFRMAGVTARGLPDIPGFSAFPELNVRVYVRHDDRPGVWFLSLDATNPLAVWGARTFFHLPYYRANMSMSREGEGVVYRCIRPDGRRAADLPPAAFVGRYSPTSDIYHAAPGTLEHWLTERYCLYARHPGGALVRTEVHHWPWPLQRAEARIEANTISAAGGLPVSGPPAYLHFARRLDVIVWRPRRVDGRRTTHDGQQTTDH